MSRLCERIMVVLLVGLLGVTLLMPAGVVPFAWFPVIFLGICLGICVTAIVHGRVDPAAILFREQRRLTLQRAVERAKREGP